MKVPMKNMGQGTIEMAHWLKALDTSPNDLNSCLDTQNPHGKGVESTPAS